MSLIEIKIDAEMKEIIKEGPVKVEDWRGHLSAEMVGLLSMTNTASPTRIPSLR